MQLTLFPTRTSNWASQSYQMDYRFQKFIMQPSMRTLSGLILIIDYMFRNIFSTYMMVRCLMR